MLDLDQRARIEALHAARDVTTTSSVLHSEGADTIDLITVAQWIIDGEDPWTEPEPTIKPDDDHMRLRFGSNGKPNTVPCKIDELA